MRRNDGGPAFPMPNSQNEGMSLRDYFAGQALPAIIAKIPTEAFKADRTLYQRVGIAAFYYADAMIEARDAG